MGYLHFEVETAQKPKIKGLPSGDLIEVIRTEAHTTILLCDGLGSGIKANIFAMMAASRLKELLNNGFSLRHAFMNTVVTMEEAKNADLPYSALTMMRILNDGLTTILCYETPLPLFLSGRTAYPLKGRTFNNGTAYVTEFNCVIGQGEGVLIVSDGVTQSGIGGRFVTGWELEGVNGYLSSLLSKGAAMRHIPSLVEEEALFNWGKKQGDDVSAILAFSRKGRVVDLFTGPPADPAKDSEAFESFFSTPGVKIICGASTAKIAARYLNKPLKVNDDFADPLTPPDYDIEGLGLVTEGAVTLNQVYNIWGEDTSKLDANNPVTVLYSLITAADRINFYIGGAKNPATDDIDFTRLGILTRDKIVPLIIEKLKAEGKLVVVKEV